jgi:hypothetical protein
VPRIGIMQALHRHVERVFTDRKDPHWGKRKLARDRNARFEMKEAPTGADCFSKCEFFFCAESAVLWPIVAPS